MPTTKEENRILASAGEIIIEWLKDKAMVSQQKMLARYYEGKTDFTGGMAEQAVYSELISDIKAKQNSLERRT